MTSPLKLAIIGGGPSAFYVASRLLHLLPAARAPELRIHIYDRLWAPHGLVRYGVAPDHPEVKNCTHKFDLAASDPRVRFFGNVHLSLHPTPYPPPPSLPPSVRQVQTEHAHALPLALHSLFPYYTHLVFATGAPRPRLHPLLPPSSVCIPALDIVHWYTVHPGSAYPPPVHSYSSTLGQIPSSASPSPIPSRVKHMTLIGHGNVSLDIARLLLTPPSLLKALDIPDHVLRSLESTWQTLRHISIIGRRGPKEVKFTAKELREMMNLEDARMERDGDYEEMVRKAENGEGIGRREARVLKLLREGSTGGSAAADGQEWKGKTFSIDFWRSPTGYTVLPDSEDAHAVLQLEETRLDSTTGRAVGTGRYESLHTDLIVTSLGYEGDAGMFGVEGDVGMGGVETASVGADSQAQVAPHSQRHSAASVYVATASACLPWYIPSAGYMRTHAGGRVLTPSGRVVRNVYAAGWAARGAQGVLAGTLLDAGDVAAGIVEDWGSGKPVYMGADERGKVTGSDRGEVAEGVEETDPLAHGWDVAGGLDGIPSTVEAGLREGRVVDYDAWRKVEEEERRRGAGVKERERMVWGAVARFLRGNSKSTA